MLFTMMYSRGGRFVDEKYNVDELRPEPGSAAAQTIQWIIDAAKKHKITQPGFMELNEVAALKAFSSGTGSFRHPAELPAAGGERTQILQGGRQDQDGPHTHRQQRQAYTFAAGLGPTA